MSSSESLVVSPSESEVESIICICGFPVLEKDILICTSCEHLYHRQCIAGTSREELPLASGLAVELELDEWICDSCMHLLSATEDLEGETGMEGPTQGGKASHTTSTSKSPGTGKDQPSCTKHKKITKFYRPESSLTRDGILERKVDRMASILKEVENQKDFQSKYGCGQEVIQLSNRLLNYSSNFFFAIFCEEVTSGLWDVAISGDKLPIGSISTEALWKHFHEYRMSDDLTTKWTSLLDMYKLNSKAIVRNILLQHTLRLLLLTLLKERNNADIQEETLPKANFTEHDEIVIRYVSGYVPFSLLKRYRKQNSEAAQGYVELLSSWKKEEVVASTSLLSYTNAWINIQDRGGLFHCNDEVYRLFRSMERCTQQYLQISNMGAMKRTNVKTALYTQLLQDKYVQKMWGVVIEGRTGKVDWEPLFHSILNYWTKIRLHAYAKIYIELRKRDSMVSTRGERGLRKELK